MTISEIRNIENCTVTPIGNPAIGYRVIANTGWYIHFNDGVEETANHYKTAALLNANYDFSLVEIVPESELPEGAEILGNIAPAIM